MNLEKLKELLAEKGLSEEEIDKIIAESKDEDEKSDSKEEGENEKVDESSDDGKDEKSEPSSEESDPADEDDDLPPGVSDVKEEGGESPSDEPSPEEVAAALEGEIPPVPPTDEPAPNPEEVPPVDAVPPAEPQPEVPAQPVGADPELLAKFEELVKTNDALKARIDSLESALQAAGILDGEVAQPVGTDQQGAVESGNTDTTDAFDDVLREINQRGKKY